MKIAIITGGSSGEREVSLRSAKNIGEIAGTFAKVEILTFPEDVPRFLQNYAFDLIIPVIHGVGGEDGSLQGLIEHVGVPYLFSGVQAHAIAIDKRRTKQIASAIGIPVAKEFAFDNVMYPVFAKPVRGGSTVNTGLIHDPEELAALREIEPDLILEEPIRGREFTVGIVEYKGETIPLPVIEIIAKDGFFDYDSKYNPEKLAQEICPAQIEEGLARQLQAYALAIHEELGVRHMSRSDFLVDPSGRVVFLEINTIPGFTATSLVPKALKEVGIDTKDLFAKWCGVGDGL